MERKQASEYPQELLDLFHEYQHGDINRRDFFDRAAKFAVGGLTVAAIWESLGPTTPGRSRCPRTTRGITTGHETVPSPPATAPSRATCAARPRPPGKLPAVLVIHENRGLNPYIEDVARRLAVLRTSWRSLPMG